MDLITTLFVATIGIAPINTDVLRDDINANYFTDIMCNATILDKITVSGGVRTDSKPEYKLYFKPIQDKYYAGLYLHWYDLLGVGIDHECRHTVLSYDSTFDRYDISKTYEYFRIGMDKDIAYAIVDFGAFMESQRYSYPRVESVSGKKVVYTHNLDDRQTTFFYRFCWGLRYKKIRFDTETFAAMPLYFRLKAALEYKMKHISVGCSYRWSSEERITDNSFNTDILQFYLKVFN
jgi:hypothetical protein